MFGSDRSNKLSLDNHPCSSCGKAVSGNANARARKAPKPSAGRLYRNLLIVMLTLAVLLCPFAQRGKAAATSLDTGAGEPLPQIAELPPYVFPEELENSILPQGDLIKNFTGENVNFFVTDISLSKNEKEVLVTAYPMVDLVLTEGQADDLRKGGELTLRRSTDATSYCGESVDWENNLYTYNYKFGVETENALYLVAADSTASDTCIWPSEDEAFKKPAEGCAAYQLRKVEDGYVLRHGTEGYWDGIWIPDKTSVLGSPCLLRMSPNFPIEYSTMDEGITAQDCVGDGCFCDESVCWMEWSHPVRMTVANGMVSSVFCVVSGDGDVEQPKMLVKGFPTNECASEEARKAAWLLTPYAHNVEQYYYRPWADGVELTWFDCISFPEDGIVVIPNELGRLPVRSIYSKALYGARGQALVIPDTVEQIAAYAFVALEVTSVEIHNPNAQIRENAFFNEEKGAADLTVRGYRNSTAEAFAKKYQYRFEAIEDAPTMTPAPTAHQKTESTLPNFIPCSDGGL